MKAKSIKKRVRLSVKQTEREKQTRRDKIHILLIAALSIIVGALAIITIFWLVRSAIDLEQTKNITIKEPAKDIDWFYNRSIGLNHIKARIDDIDGQIAVFIKKHGTDETGYAPNEQEKIHSLRSAKVMLANDFNVLAAEYNGNAQYMNRSWNKSLPRQIYDIPT